MAVSPNCWCLLGNRKGYGFCILEESFRCILDSEPERPTKLASGMLLEVMQGRLGVAFAARQSGFQFSMKSEVAAFYGKQTGASNRKHRPGAMSVLPMDGSQWPDRQRHRETVGWFLPAIGYPYYQGPRT
ncbi:MAG: hypothetical protein CMM01_09685 [Rhodopirellula sp.]|nr:hypothetical protein [Rhodopirellula sp.]